MLMTIQVGKSVVNMSVPNIYTSHKPGSRERLERAVGVDQVELALNCFGNCFHTYRLTCLRQHFKQSHPPIGGAEACSPKRIRKRPITLHCYLHTSFSYLFAIPLHLILNANYLQ